MDRKHLVDRSRREFARLFALGGSAALFTSSPAAWRNARQVRPAGPSADERYWAEVRAGFVMPDGFACLNAANLCPSPARVLEA
jgi:hypothetical protein